MVMIVMMMVIVMMMMMMVPFPSSQTSQLVVQRRPRHEAYAALGPAYCPTAYWSAQQF